MEPATRISSFDGLRALAFLGVFAHHALKIPLLWMGVDLFFVLSGYLITRNLLASRETSTTSSGIRVFFFRRLLRIAPPYYLALALSMLVEPLSTADLAWYLAFASNIRDSVMPPISGPFNSLWSIAVEEQFYLLWPWIVLLFPRRWIGRSFVLVFVAAPVFRFGFGSIGLDAVYRLMPCRMDLLAAGSLLALVDRNFPRWIASRAPVFLAVGCSAVACFAALSVAIPTFRTSQNTALFNVIGFALSTCFFTCTVAYVRGLERGLIRSVLQMPVLQYVGKISYMCYLLHMLALDLVVDAGFARWGTAGLGLALTLSAAALSWHLLETPLQRWKPLVALRPRA